MFGCVCVSKVCGLEVETYLPAGPGLGAVRLFSSPLGLFPILSVCFWARSPAAVTVDAVSFAPVEAIAIAIGQAQPQTHGPWRFVVFGHSAETSSRCSMCISRQLLAACWF